MANPIVVSTLGPWFISYSFLTMLYGMGILQSWLYFHWYRNDHWSLKSICADHSVMGGYVHYSGKSFRGDILPTDDHLTQQLSSYLSEVTVQSYFAYVVYTYAIGSAGYCKWVRVLATDLKRSRGDYSHGYLWNSSWRDCINCSSCDEGLSYLCYWTSEPPLIPQLPATFACDLLITISLFITLRGKKPNIASGIDDMYPALAQTNTMLQKLMVNAVNRGFFDNNHCCSDPYFTSVFCLNYAFQSSLHFPEPFTSIWELYQAASFVGNNRKALGADALVL
ncbi:hypothetical protein BDP27DRAFT_1367125 [Rhodocollybia butyracea]|uniref:Uncharacterized protein n=1 Tax=Rhodocollybia butyracea TaxID=206335 RepID=A0A9P5PF86_9AGAR|nr:hypothetical protein BDP27DRAFT_1367125 [Rhodocollybia butyracea]